MFGIIKRVLLLIMVVLSTSFLCAQGRKIEYKSSLSTFFSTKKVLPFWLISNKYGIIPNGNGGILEFGIYSNFTKKHKIQFAYGISVAGILSELQQKIVLDQLYFSGRWRNIRLDIGMIQPEEKYNGISSTNGNFIYSTNSRISPGVNLRSDFIKIPFMKDVLYIKFNWADYTMIDVRFVKNTRLHNKSAYLKIKPLQRLEIIIGLEHWVQWGGKSPVYGKLPSSFKDYIKIVTAHNGGNDATQSDELNALGNHLGREHVSINYLSENFTLSFYHDIPFEDGSGTDFRSFPDGTYCLYYGSRMQKQWITDMIYEFYYTKYQSGSQHTRPATPEEMEKQDPNSHFYGRKVLGGCDNYFNNSMYCSGWTLYGRTIGSPLMTAGTVGIMNNRIIGHHIGFKGWAFGAMLYKVMLSYTINYGTYVTPLKNVPHQFSGAFDIKLPIRKFPFSVETGIYVDFGGLLNDNFGIKIKFVRKGML